MDNLQDKNKKDKSSIGPMFDSIARRYDFLNHFLSFGTDKRWRRKAVMKISETHRNPKIIDVATGTGDLAIAAIKLDPVSITGIDISGKMLELGQKKIEKRGLSGSISFRECDSENICFEDNYFDVAMVAFGVRNFSDPLKGLTEMRRVIRKGGLIMVLEFSKPDISPFKQIYSFYFRHLLPFFGGLFSNDRKAYRYLHDSVMEFADNELFMGMLIKAGFGRVSQLKLTCGIASIYTGVKE